MTCDLISPYIWNNTVILKTTALHFVVKELSNFSEKSEPNDPKPVRYFTLQAQILIKMLISSSDFKFEHNGLANKNVSNSSGRIRTRYPNPVW